METVHCRRTESEFDTNPNLAHSQSRGGSLPDTISNAMVWSDDFLSQNHLEVKCVNGNHMILVFDQFKH